MKKISTIYQSYQIMPNLQAHMFRVAAVAKIILSHLREPLSAEETHHIISACLLHDMGNIVKFNLNYFPEFLEPQGLVYWKGVQNKFLEKYGREQHNIHHKIAEELRVHQRTLQLIDAVGAWKACENKTSDDIGRKICAYSDMRVEPYGITSLNSRLTDLKNRHIKSAHAENEHEYKSAHVCLFEIEKELFSLTDISPGEITEENAASIIALLAEYSPS
jgi:hypothetical protein